MPNALHLFDIFCLSKYNDSCPSSQKSTEITLSHQIAPYEMYIAQISHCLVLSLQCSLFMSYVQFVSHHRDQVLSYESTNSRIHQKLHELAINCVKKYLSLCLIRYYFLLFCGAEYMGIYNCLLNHPQTLINFLPRFKFRCQALFNNQLANPITEKSQFTSLVISQG